MEQVFNIVLVKLAVGFILLMVYRDILTNILHCSLCMTKKIYRTGKFAGERRVENICFVRGIGTEWP